MASHLTQLFIWPSFSLPRFWCVWHMHRWNKLKWSTFRSKVPIIIFFSLLFYLHKTLLNGNLVFLSSFFLSFFNCDFCRSGAFWKYDARLLQRSRWCLHCIWCNTKCDIWCSHQMETRFRLKSAITKRKSNSMHINSKQGKKIIARNSNEMANVVQCRSSLFSFRVDQIRHFTPFRAIFFHFE